MLSLDGLRTSPLASYTAALGVLRLVAEQADPRAKGWWQNDQFQLQCKLDGAGLLNFFLHRYRPTPMASPWNAGGGFFDLSADSVVSQIEGSEDPRFAAYGEAITVIKDCLKAHGLTSKPSTPTLKFAFLETLHNSLPIDARRYLDALVSLLYEKPRYHTLFLSGGNDGRIDFAKNLMERLVRLLLDSDPDSESLLQSALFDSITEHLEPLTAGPHDPSSTGGINASSQEQVALPLSNPWLYVLGMEGTLLLADGCGQVDRHPADYPSSSPDEARLDDIWLPYWSTPQTLEQLQEHLSADPRGHTLRYTFLQRNGRGHFAIPLARREISWQDGPSYLKDLEEKLSKLGRNDLDEILAKEPPNPTQILEALGSLNWHGAEPVTLKVEWVQAADDGTPEFGCALALSGLGLGNVDSHLNLRSQLHHFVGPDLCHRMLGLLRYRLRSANKVSKLLTLGGYPRFKDPFWSSHPSRLQHLEVFLMGQCDEARLERLFRALCLVKEGSSNAPVEEPAFLSFPFAIAKLAFHQHLDRRPTPVEIAEALAANRADSAIALAARFLEVRHPGFPQVWPPCPPLDSSTARRWAAALLFPISNQSYDSILGDLCAR